MEKRKLPEPNANLRRYVSREGGTSAWAPKPSLQHGRLWNDRPSIGSLSHIPAPRIKHLPRGWQRVQDLDMVDNFKPKGFSAHWKGRVHLNSQWWWQLTQGLRRLQQEETPAWSIARWAWSSPAAGSCWHWIAANESQFSFMMKSPVGGGPHYRAGSTSKSSLEKLGEGINMIKIHLKE